MVAAALADPLQTKAMKKPSWLLLIICVFACLVPMIISAYLAKSLGSEELIDSGLGLATVAAVLAVVKLFGNKTEQQ